MQDFISRIPKGCTQQRTVHCVHQGRSSQKFAFKPQAPVSCIHAHALSVFHSLFTQDMNRAGPHFSAHRSSHPHTKSSMHRINWCRTMPRSCHIAGRWGWRTTALRLHTELASHWREQIKRYHKTKSPGFEGAGGTTPSLTTCSPQGAQPALNRSHAGKRQKNSNPPERNKRQSSQPSVRGLALSAVLPPQLHEALCSYRQNVPFYCGWPLGTPRSIQPSPQSTNNNVQTHSPWPSIHPTPETEHAMLTAWLHS